MTGVTAVLVTPYRQDRLDEGTLEDLAARTEQAGVHVLTSLGNTAEVFQLTPAERTAHLSAVARASASAVLLAGVSGAAASVLAEIETAASLGYSAAMVHEPADPFGDSEGFVRYYAEISRHSALPLVLYVRSDRLDVDGLRRVVAAEAVVGVKFARADLGTLSVLLEGGAAAGCTWVNGAAESRAPQFLALGLTGFTSGVADVRPDLALAVHAALRAGDREALERQVGLLAPVEALRSTGRGKYNVAVLKELLRMHGVEAGPVRPPHCEVTASGREVLQRAVAAWPPPAPA
ncbi:dihydrodipicolinate synthase family protein [Auraticoccus sp. F435]|uniref:Dihydrodipicolinate synthase family protein n=1 Tax=Auraticoccus cholistanensis TaxID=2656650 RepID=A0A6A9V114_9ACTN|nr:dihydrodipicolinate synthase family protein [Auraticoccus cholistanensis]MVA76619.1 dihydrodipicolinate synthase family protein [Auraticoccus cholistanensis]